MELQAEAVLQQLREGKKPALLLVVGEEPYYRQKIEQAFRRAVFGEAEAPFGLLVLSGTPTLEAVRQGIESYAFDGLDNLVVVRDCQWFKGKKAGADNDKEATEKEKNRQLAAVLAAIPAHSHILLLAPQADKRTVLYKACRDAGWVTESQPLKSYEAAAWLQQALQAQGLRLTADARGLVEERLAMVEQVSCALLETEIGKWQLFLQGRTSITRDDLELIFGQLPETSGFRLLDALGERRLADAFLLLRQQLKQGDDAMALAGLLAFYLRRLLQAKQCRGAREAAALFRLPNFVAERLLKQAAGFNTRALESALAALGDWNAGVRRGGPQLTGLEDILLQLMLADKQKKTLPSNR